MRSNFLFIAVASIAAAVPAAAQDIPKLTLVPGQAVTVPIDEGDRAGAIERYAAQWTPFDLVAARHLAGQRPPEAPEPVASPITGPEDAEPPPIPGGQVRLRFHSIAGRNTLLVVENGLGRAIAYRAQITSNGETKPTDVCLVMPGLPSYEHWPYPIQRIELTGFRYVPWRPGQAPTCE